MHNLFCINVIKRCFKHAHVVPKDCMINTLPFSQNEMMWWLRLQIVIITRPVY